MARGPYRASSSALCMKKLQSFRGEPLNDAEPTSPGSACFKPNRDGRESKHKAIPPHHQYFKHNLNYILQHATAASDTI